MSRVIKLLCVLVGCVACIAATKNSRESLIGIWRFVKCESSDNNYRITKGELETQFTDSGDVIMKLRDPSSGVQGTQKMVGRFTLTAPDRVTISLNDETHERYRYRFKDGLLRMEHMDFPLTNTFKRVQEFSL